MPLFSEETCRFGRGEGGQGGRTGEALPVASPWAGVAADLLKLLRPFGLFSDECMSSPAWVIPSEWYPYPCLKAHGTTHGLKGCLVVYVTSSLSMQLAPGPLLRLGT